MIVSPVSEGGLRFARMLQLIGNYLAITINFCIELARYCIFLSYERKQVIGKYIYIIVYFGMGKILQFTTLLTLNLLVIRTYYFKRTSEPL